MEILFCGVQRDEGRGEGEGGEGKTRHSPLLSSFFPLLALLFPSSPFFSIASFSSHLTFYFLSFSFSFSSPSPPPPPPPTSFPFPPPPFPLPLFLLHPPRSLSQPPPPIPHSLPPPPPPPPPSHSLSFSSRPFTPAPPFLHLPSQRHHSGQYKPQK